MPGDPPLILVVEDDAVLRFVTCTILSAAHYRVIEAGTGQQALVEVAAQHPDAILLDLGLPDMDGLDVIPQIHDSPIPPIIVFSARGVEKDKVAAFDAGAVDYIEKPFVASDLLARMRSALGGSAIANVDPSVDRRMTTAENPVYQVGDLTIDFDRLEVTLTGELVQLTQTELRLSLTLVRSAGRVVTNRQLMNSAWGPNSESESLRLRVCMGQLRHKLESEPTRPRYLKTESGVGYRLVSE